MRKVILICLLFIFTLVSAQTGSVESARITLVMCEIINLVRNTMAAVLLVLIILAAVVYAAGQVLGAETRARANVWATSMVVGSTMAAFIYIITPVFIGTLLSGQITGATEQGLYPTQCADLTALAELQKQIQEGEIVVQQTAFQQDDLLPPGAIDQVPIYTPPV
ncbi:hypothetical protein JXB01_04430 [Candidatus Micrarchaeota archaeon]|nr:hypothetical protein [Candidatus Micrarchaeota archaeon]